MSFGLKSNTQNNNNAQNNGEQGERYESGISYCEYNQAQFDMIDVEATKSKKGLIKEFSATGVLNYMQTLGYQKQPNQMYDTRQPLPEEGEEYSAGEIEDMAKFEANYYIWDTDDTGKRVRKQGRRCRPEPELVLAFDFNEYMFDYSKTPFAKSADEDLKPLRISMNGWFNPKLAFNMNIRNTINYKTKEMHEGNPLIKVAKAAGILEQFTKSGNVNDGHEYALLAGATVDLDVSAELTEWKGKTYIDFKLKNPAAVVDMKLKGKVIATKESLIEDANQNLPEFVGIEYNSDSFTYTKEMLENMRKEWKIVASRSTSFHPNKVKSPDFTLGCEWEDSTLYKACIKHGIWLPPEALGSNGGKVDEPQQQAPAEKQEPAKKEEKIVYNEPAKIDNSLDDGFEDPDIPF